MQKLPLPSRSISRTDYAVQKIADTGGLNFQKPIPLTKERRLRMNSLVEKVNGKIADAVKAAGDKVVFVNYDGYFGDVEGRMCAPHIQEPSPLKYGINCLENNQEMC